MVYILLLASALASAPLPIAIPGMIVFWIFVAIVTRERNDRP
jgi:hypothetical protein